MYNLFKEEVNGIACPKEIHSAKNGTWIISSVCIDDGTRTISASASVCPRPFREYEDLSGGALLRKSALFLYMVRAPAGLCSISKVCYISSRGY
jgi:hypothetical protein